MYFFVLKRKFILIMFSLILVMFLTFSFSKASHVETSQQMQDGVFVPVLMYHSILKDPSAAGKYVVSPQTLEADLKYLKEKGYTTVLSSDLVAYVDEGKPLPEKPVIITFDDGHANNLLYALPIFEKLDMCGVICIVGKYSESASLSEDHHPSYAYLSWDEINILKTSGRFEIANHSYDMHKSAARKGTKIQAGEDCYVYNEKLKTDLEKTQKLLLENCNTTPIAFSYPFGAVCSQSLPVVRDVGFRVSYGCAEKVNYITDDASLYCLGRFNRASGMSTYEFMQKVLK